jgi:HD-like signal output (HDOD) protein
MKTKILFVDDEENILQGLERSLRTMCNQWEMHFSVGWKNGLELLSQTPFNAVVSDMQMPGMDGVQFLTKVRDINPSAVRFALSGSIKEGILVEATGICHQFLTKPCKPKVLQETISRTMSLQDTIHNEAMKKTISQIHQLPSVPVLYQKVKEELQCPEPETLRISEIISQDVAMTAKILHLVNTAFFGISRHVSNIEEAIQLLGFDLIEKLVLTVEIFATAGESVLPHRYIKRLWAHSFATGQLAKNIAIAENSDKMTIDHSMMSGILHDIGKLIIATNFTDCYLSPTSGGEYSSWQNEKKFLLGDTHSEVGAYLMGLWGLPEPIIEAIAFHHQPNRLDCQDFTPLTAVHVANALMHEISTAENEIAEHRRLNLKYLSKLGLESRILTWQQISIGMMEDN